MQVLDSHVIAVRDCLFDVENMQRVLTYLVARHTGPDALLTLACQALTQELCLAWTEEGFAPFRHMPQHIIPYDVMTKRQLACVQDALQHAVEQHLTQTCPKAGNGLYVYVASSTHVAVKAAPSSVLVAAVRMLRKSRCLRSLTTDVVCQRMIDRLHASVHVPRHLFQDAIRTLATDDAGRGPEEKKRSALLPAAGAPAGTHDACAACAACARAACAACGLAEPQAQGGGAGRQQQALPARAQE